MLGGKFRQSGEMLLFQQVNSGDHFSIAGLPATLSGDRFVVASQAGNESSFVRMSLDRTGDSIGYRAAGRVDAGRPVGVDSIRHKDNIGVAGGVHPNGGTRKPSVAKGADRKQLAAIAGE